MIPKPPSTKPNNPPIALDMGEHGIDIPPTARIRLDSEVLVANWRTLDQMSGAASAGAAIKADAYGLGVRGVVRRLLAAGCNDFYVANWQEAAEIGDLTSGSASVSVLNGVRDEDMAFAASSLAKPVLNSLEQVQRWTPTGRSCDIMINSGMNRLGIEPEELGQVDLGKLNIDIVMSHLASADENVPQNREQLDEFNIACQNIGGQRRSLANSAGIALGDEFHFDCTRPGLSLYGGKPRAELHDKIRQVVFPEAQIIQTRQLREGDKVGYNAKFVASGDMKIATLAMGYADGYLRGFSGRGAFRFEEKKLPVLGRVSMDLIAIDLAQAPELGDGDWVECEYDLPVAAEQSGLSQYELLTGLGQRLDRIWS